MNDASSALKQYQTKHFAGNLARRFVTGGEKPHQTVQAQVRAELEPDDDEIGEYYPPEGDLRERNNMRNKNINPVKEDNYIRPDAREFDNEVEIDTFEGPSEMDFGTFGGDEKSGLDLGPITTFDYSMPAHSRDQSSNVRRQAPDMADPAIWEATDIDVEKLIEHCVEKGLARNQIKKVLNTYLK
jgi:hypothetical protein